jgi:hypothetical protein
MHILFFSTDEERALFLGAYTAILRLTPKLKDLLPYQADVDSDYFYKVIEEVRPVHILTSSPMTYAIQMQDGCNAARSEIIKRIKDNTGRYLRAGRTPVEVDDTQIQHKPLRGLNNCNIGRLIIPADDVREWDLNPDSYVPYIMHISAK